MFYSHQLLARKAPLSQIWMAATMQAKMNRRELDEIDIIQICEEILNPSVPMALRLSGILMDGVAIVYERKVALLYDDVNRLLAEMNLAWKMKPAVEPTVLPKGKVQAKFNAVTFPDADNIILYDNSESFQADPTSFNRYQRFDIERDEETQFYFSSQEQTQKPLTPVHTLPPEMQPQRDDILESKEGKHSHQSSSEKADTEQKAQKELRKRLFARKRARRQPPFIVDDEQTMVPSNHYQSWIQDKTDIWGRRLRIVERLDTIDELMESYMESLMDKEPNIKHQQGFSYFSDADNITLDDNLKSFHADPTSFNRYERFDIEGDEGTQFYFPSQEHTQKPSNPVHSPPPEMQPQRDDILEPEEEKYSHQSSAEQGDTEQNAQTELQKRHFARKRARRQPLFIMDEEQTMVPSNLHQSWLQDTTDIWGKRPKIGERKHSFEDTCHSMRFLGLVSEEDDIFSYYPRGNGLKVAIIDQGCCVGLKQHKYDATKQQMKYDNESLYLNRRVWRHSIHKCHQKTRLSMHGVFCASILVGRNREVNLMNVCEGITRGVVPFSKLYSYALGCDICTVKYEYMVEAIKHAQRSGVRVISMSLRKKNLRDLNTHETDILGRATLEATRGRVLICLTAGNRGPKNRTINFGMPWVMNVGACTVGKVLTTEILVATDKMVRGLEVKERYPFQGGCMNVVDKIEGYSTNLFEDIRFYPFRMHENSRDKDAVVYTASEEDCVTLDSGKDSINYHKKQTTNLANFPSAAIRKEETNRLWHWFAKLGENMHVKICTSKFKDDPRGIFIPEFSSRGPSLTYPQIVSPDVVAPGVSIVGTAPYLFPINSDEAVQPIYADQTIMTGTSMAAPHVAGSAAIVMHHHPDWTAYAVKSALMTTARSLAGGTIPGDEFTYGAGVVQPMMAIDPGLIYDEVYHHFDRYMKGRFPVHRLNIPSFCAAFAPSPQSAERNFERELTFVGEGTATYKSKLEIFTKTLDPNVSISVYPTKLSFKRKGDKAQFNLTVRLLPRAEGRVSARLIWTARNRHDVASPIIFYADTTNDEGAKQPNECLSLH